MNVDGSDSNEPLDEPSFRKVMGYRDVPAHIDEDEGQQIPEQRETQADYITHAAVAVRIFK